MIRKLLSGTNGAAFTVSGERPKIGLRVYVPCMQIAGHLIGYRPPYWVVEMDNGAQAILEPCEIFTLH